MEAGLKLIVEADVSSVDKKLSQLEKQAAFLKKQLEKPINAEINIDIQNKLNDVNRQIQQLNNQKINILVNPNASNSLTQLSTKLDGLKKGSGQANVALTNLSRVVQDAPFGFIGIANNIDPLLQSFQSLKKETGSSGAALKSLGASLIGPAGIGVAIAAVSSLITVAIQKYGSLSNALSALIGNLSNAEIAQSALNKASEENIGKAQSEIVTLKALLAIAKDKNASDATRQQAISKLNKDYDIYNKQLTLENINNQNVTESTNRLTESLIRQAKVRGAQDYISKLSTKQTELLIEQQKQTDELIKIGKQGFGAALAADLKNRLLGGQGFLAGIGNSTSELKDLNEQLDFAEKALEKLLGEEAKAGTLFIPEPKAPKKAKTARNVIDEKEAANQIFSIYEKLQNDLNKLEEERLKRSAKNKEISVIQERKIIQQLGEARLQELDIQYEKERREVLSKVYKNESDKQRVLAALQDSFKQTRLAIVADIDIQVKDFTKTAFDFTKKLRDTIDKQIREKPISISFSSAITMQGDIDKQYKDTFEKIKKYGINYRNPFAVNTKEYEEYLKKVGDAITKNEKLASTITDKLSPAIDGFFQALIEGSGSPIKAFVNALKQLVIQFAAAIVKAIIFKAIMAALNNATGGFAGILSQAAGLMGVNVGNTANTVNTGNIAGSANIGQQRLVTEIRGSSLALILQRTESTRNRLG